VNVKMRREGCIFILWVGLLLNDSKDQMMMLFCFIFNKKILKFCPVE
jgi:hypothetical protein